MLSTAISLVLDAEGGKAGSQTLGARRGKPGSD
jgi:hypothetical protein